MQTKKDLVRKPNQTIMMTNGEITATQRKAYNVILHNAWKDLKKDTNQILFYMQISDLKERAGIKAKNNVELKNNIKKLRDIGIETIKENGDWCVFSLLSQADKKGDLLEIQLPEKIRQALIHNNYYSTLDLLTLKTLECKYSVIFYEMAIRYSKMKIPEMTIEEVKDLTGTTKVKSYADFGKFRAKVLEPAVSEINEKTDIIFNYEPVKTGRKVTSINFKIEKKAEEISTNKPSAKTPIAQAHQPSYHDVKKKTSHIPQHVNFKQRKYSQEEYDSMFENVIK